MKFDPTVYGRSLAGNFGQMYVRPEGQQQPARFQQFRPLRSRRSGLGQMEPMGTRPKAPLSYKYPWLGGLIRVATAGFFGGLTILATDKVLSKSRTRRAKILTGPIAIGSLAGAAGLLGAGIIGDKIASMRI